MRDGEFWKLTEKRCFPAAGTGEPLLLEEITRL
jgi:hypothetical protein